MKLFYINFNTAKTSWMEKLEKSGQSVVSRAFLTAPFKTIVR